MTAVFVLWLTLCPASVDTADAHCQTTRHVCKQSECAEIIRAGWTADTWPAGAVLVRG